MNESEGERKKGTKKSVKEIVVVDDDVEDEGVKEKDKANLPTSLHQALATAFSLDLRIETQPDAEA